MTNGESKAESVENAEDPTIEEKEPSVDSKKLKRKPVVCIMARSHPGDSNISFITQGEIRPKICCFFENLGVNHFTFTALHSADKFSKEQLIFGLRPCA